MKARIIPIGNSRGVRIPKPLLEEAGLSDEVEIIARGNALVIRPARKPREGWEESFAEMARNGDDAELIDVAPGLSPYDEDEWVWESADSTSSSSTSTPPSGARSKKSGRASSSRRTN
jgi:antitoxin MazE